MYKIFQCLMAKVKKNNNPVLDQHLMMSHLSSDWLNLNHRGKCMHVEHQNLCPLKAATDESPELLLFHKQTSPWGFYHPFSAEMRLRQLTTHCKCVVLPHLHSLANNSPFCFSSCRHRKTKTKNKQTNPPHPHPGFRLNRRVLPGATCSGCHLKLQPTSVSHLSEGDGLVMAREVFVCPLHNLAVSYWCHQRQQASGECQSLFSRRGEERGAEWRRERFIHWALEWLIRGNHFIFGSPTF